MDGDDEDTMTAYYCFVNFGWPPQQYEALPLRERVLVKLFVVEDLKHRKKIAESSGRR